TDRSTVDPEAEKGESCAHGREDRRTFLDRESESAREKRVDFGMDRAEVGFRSPEQDEVIHVAHVSRRAKMLANEVVEPIEHEVCEPLAGEISDRESDTRRYDRLRPAEDDVYEFKDAAIFDDAPQRLSDDCMRDRLEATLDIEFQEPIV